MKRSKAKIVIAIICLIVLTLSGCGKSKQPEGTEAGTGSAESIVSEAVNPESTVSEAADPESSVSEAADPESSTSAAGESSETETEASTDSDESVKELIVESSVTIVLEENEAIGGF